MSAFTFEGWFAPDAFTAQYQRLFSRVEAPSTDVIGNGYFAFIHGGAGGPELAFEAWSGGNFLCGVGRLALSCDAPCGKFFHVAFTYGGGRMAGYVNGALAAPNGSTACAGMPTVPGALFVVGNYVGVTCPECAFVGDVSNIAIYDRALAASEIQAHYQAAGAH